jgi:hypothetical protein
MPAYLNDRILDNGLTVLDTEGTRILICSSQPATYGAADTATLGEAALAAGGIGAPAARSPDGRRVTVAAVTSGSVTASGTATHWAIVDDTNSRLLAANMLSAPQSVVSGNTWTLAAFDIGIPGPA